MYADASMSVLSSKSCDLANGSRCHEKIVLADDRQEVVAGRIAEEGCGISVQADGPAAGAPASTPGQQRVPLAQSGRRSAETLVECGAAAEAGEPSQR